MKLRATFTPACILLLLFLPFGSSCSTAPRRAVLAVEHGHASHNATGTKAIISTQGSATTAAARRILVAGGNLIDAAVAASFTISVERPHSTGIGGGGFFLFREGKSGKTFAVDFRERAPAKAREKMFLNAQGDVVPGLSTEGILSAGTPGLVAGLLEIHAKWGKLPLPAVMAPAIELAEQGFAVYPALAKALEASQEVLVRFPSSRKIFMRPDGAPFKQGEILVQKDLGQTLRKIAKQGRSVFYAGEITRAILAESKRHHGLFTARDFQDYAVKWREPVRGTFKGFEIVSMPPPSSGGTHVIEILNILENDFLKKKGLLSAESVHLIASAMQLAFADRAKHMGDPDFVNIPVAGLTDKGYAEKLRGSIPSHRARKADEVRAGAPIGAESNETTHFSLMDAEGNVVASTQTINGWFGSGLVAEGTGILLNNEMDDFSSKPGAPNLFGAVGGSANAIAPKKTPLSSMSPSLILKDGVPVLSVGAPGGTRIITCVAQTILNVLEYGLSLPEALALPRMHHQWKPDVLALEAPGPGEAVEQELRRMGYTLKIEADAVPCRVMAVAKDGESFIGASDPRDAGTAAGL